MRSSDWVKEESIKLQKRLFSNLFMIQARTHAITKLCQPRLMQIGDTLNPGLSFILFDASPFKVLLCKCIKYNLLITYTHLVREKLGKTRIFNIIYNESSKKSGSQVATTNFHQLPRLTRDKRGKGKYTGKTKGK